MKTLRLFLIVSVVANAALAFILWRGAPSTAAGGAPARTEPHATPAPAPVAQARGENPPPAGAGDPHVALRERLTSLGFSRDVVNAVVRGIIEEPRRARTRELYAALAKSPWWAGRQSFTPAQDRELRALMRAEREEILRVLGPLGYADDGQLERYSYLDPEKAARLVALQRDYAELRRDASDDPNGNRAELTARLKLLESEHDRDVAALLTPEERGRFDERESRTARNLSYRFEFFEGTDAEYQAALAAQRRFDEKINATLPSAGAGAEAAQARGEAMRELADTLRAALGPERYAQYLQAQRPEYRALVELQRRFDVPAAAFQQAAQVHLEISNEVTRIADDAALDAAEKRAQLTALATRATDGIRAALGPSIGDTYLAATRSTWIDVLARGGAYSASASGSTGTRSFNPAERPPPPAPKT